MVHQVLKRFLEVTQHGEKMPSNKRYNFVDTRSHKTGCYLQSEIFTKMCRKKTQVTVFSNIGKFVTIKDVAANITRRG